MIRKNSHERPATWATPSACRSSRFLGTKTDEYQGISTERAQRILNALGVRFRLEVEEPIPQDDSDQEKVPA